jgi:hypothetical protein
MVINSNAINEIGFAVDSNCQITAIAGQAKLALSAGCFHNHDLRRFCTAGPKDDACT